MAITLLRESDDISSLCHVCGETATNDESTADDLWIACDRCGRALCKLATDRTDTWDMYLESVVFGLRTKKQITTKFSPFYMLFGVEARYPCEVPEMYEVINAYITILVKQHNERSEEEAFLVDSFATTIS
ncbi:hypothetical protein MHYP_G00314360 [Metynnis hypsauchen]